MPAQEMSHFIYIFDPVRPELATEPDAWTQEELCIADKHFAHLEKATREGTVILAGRSPDVRGQRFLSSKWLRRKKHAGSWRAIPLSPAVLCGPACIPSAQPWMMRHELTEWTFDRPAT